ncbi:MAG: sodium/solute symporter [Sedimentisphaeraceae bacterium JB056]
MTDSLVVNVLAAIRVFDVTTLVFYLLAMVGVGVYFASKNKTTEDYFFADNSMPGWAVGLSMFATSISTVTFVGFPAAAFVEDWRMLLINIGLIPGSFLAIYLLIPFFKKAGAVSTLDYVGERLGTIPRVYCAITMIAVQLIRLGTVLFLMAIPLSYITGQPIILIMIITGILTMVYTVFGGIEAVIWTDVIQTFILVGGSITVAILAVRGLPDGSGLGYVITEGIKQGKIAFGDMDFDLSNATFYTMVILGLSSFLAIVTDPTVVQRWMTAKSLYQARRATWLNLVLCIVIWTFFYFVGTCLFMYYQFNPSDYVTGLVNDSQVDKLVPYFIVEKAPIGIAGLITAGVAAAAMSSLSSSINICGTLFVGDILRKHISPNKTEEYYFKSSLVTTFIVSLVMMVGALVFYRVPKRFMVELSMVVTMIFSGCLVGLFFVALFTKIVDSMATIAALVLGTIINAYFAFCLVGWIPEEYSFMFHKYLIGLVVTICFVFFALQISLFSRKKYNMSMFNLAVLNAYAITNYLGVIHKNWQMFEPSVRLIVAVNVVFGVIAFATAKLWDEQRHSIDVTNLTVWTVKNRSLN